MPRSPGLNDRALRPRRIRVVAGILQDSHGRILVSERLGDSPFAGLWEFPGGKISPGESPETALQRELVEEIGVHAIDSRHFMHLRHDYDDRRVAIDFYRVARWEGTPWSREGQRLEWWLPGEIAAGAMLPADEPVLRALAACRS
ncbi:MAG: 8-oxo-dGTP diphosphatase MutT [Woeseiaceae bacterium]|nr:8-oxo-dGTP diphosphatase MutT [Woeseiaceae bacterium]